MNKDTKFLIDIVIEASKIITPEFEIKVKDEQGGVVTNFDFEIENFIISKLKEKYPNFDIISEEFNPNKQLTKNCFVIDPLDGTSNFSHGLPLWGIQVACIKNGKVCNSVILLPKLNELYYADSSGAFLNGNKISVKQWDQTQAIFVIDGGNKPPSFARLFQKTRNIRINYAHCVNLAWTACGKYSGVIFKKDTCWDYIPGEYLVKQAGGFIIDEPETHIAASNPEFANLLKQECGKYENDRVLTKHD